MAALNELDEAVQTVTREIRDMGTTQILLLEGKKLEMGALNEHDEAVQTVTGEIRGMWATGLRWMGETDRDCIMGGIMVGPRCAGADVTFGIGWCS